MIVKPTMFDENDVLYTLTLLTTQNKIKWRKRCLELNDPLGDGYVSSHNGVVLNLITATKVLHFDEYKFYDALELLLAVQGYEVDSSKDKFINTINTFFDGLCVKQGHSLTNVEGDKQELAP